MTTPLETDADALRAFSNSAVTRDGSAATLRNADTDATWRRITLRLIGAVQMPGVMLRDLLARIVEGAKPAGRRRQSIRRLSRATWSGPRRKPTKR
ncbi:hypothetical protein M3I53_22250 [Paraburkholderia sp. CNPSo 3272]|uniref:hypothetical protein n=1 Tax=Paraburkholderia sp. CNPSo 3272 TaxID=2940931 RepID=UPI0020B7E832|nr:hypothetical protein [Paraburkholderia sp. CNPSo 3272]MCP3725818.1 hypothetical protein [Paraburkholderia sp. CNPSo 3272]